MAAIDYRGTTHTRSTLQRALDQCAEADRLMDAARNMDSPESSNAVENAKVLLKAAATNALHAYSDLQQERFVVSYGPGQV